MASKQISASSNFQDISMTPEDRLKRMENKANDFTVDRHQPIRRYYNSGPQMIRMADTYYEEENIEKAYILYFKYVTLFVEKLPKHPEYKLVEIAKEKNRVMKTLKVVMSKCEELKKLIRIKYSDEYEVYLLNAEEERKLEEEKKVQEDIIKKQLEGAKLREEVARYHDEKERHLAAARDRELALWQQYQQIREKGQAIPNSQTRQPSAPITNEVSLDDIELSINQDVMLSDTPAYNRSAKPHQIPTVPDRSMKPSSILSTPNKHISSVLRRVVVPSILMPTFLSVAQTNTTINVETCGILAGKMSRDMFTISHLIIPKQSGTSDSCTTQGEEELFEIQDKENLITLGWIHTHPSQTAFLSSVDLHTQLSYQLMLPEAIAIVCSPRYNETGFFVLTPDYGLDYIGNCRETGFHPHPKEPPLFENGNHVQVVDNIEVKLIDLRN